MQEVAKAAGLVAVAAFLLWKVACRVKRGRNKQVRGVGTARHVDGNVGGVEQQLCRS